MNCKDLTGKRFGSLTVLHRVESHGKDGHAFWLCRCDCGNEFEVASSKIGKQTVSCPKCVYKKKSEDYTENLEGKRFGRLTVVKLTNKKLHSFRVWTCVCDCGNTVDVASSHLKNGSTKSCGCLNSETSKKSIIICNEKNDVNYCEGTYIPSIRNKTIFKSNTSGVRGVHFCNQKQMYVATIVFKGVTYYLGSSKDLDVVKKLRIRAEEKTFDAFVEWYDKEIKNKDKEDCCDIDAQ